jgi:class 3 adenylate cyclase
VLGPRNRRFAISAEAFEEITEALSTGIAAAIVDGDGEVLTVLRRTAPSAVPEAVAEQGRLESYIFQEPVQNCLLRDFDGVVPVLTRSRALKRERDAAGSWGALLARYADVTDCVLRCQVVSVLRERLERSGRGRERAFDEGVYCFSRHADVVNEVRQVVILFGDLRDFTRTSEGAISERGLAEELYRIFDPAAIVVGTFGGRMDKYLGDGFMATFGGEGSGADASLAALRAAVAVQKILERLQTLKKTAFRMGLSLHSGRAAIARFLLDDLRSETTPIGRQVNIAGRLSSPGEEEEEGWKSLVREGIVVSGPFLDDLRKSVDLESFDEDERRGSFFHDEASQFKLCFDYAGEGQFKGLEGTLSLYRLTAEESGGDE